MAESPDFNSLKDAIVQWGNAMRRTAEAVRRAGQQVAVAIDADRALRAFIADGGDVQSIRDIEELFGVTHA